MHAEKTLSETSILFLGAGNMAEALVRGLCESGAADPVRICVLNAVDAEKRVRLAERYGVRTGSVGSDLADEARRADWIVLAMKPKDVGRALSDLVPHVSEGHLVISVVAGLSIGAIQRAIGRRPVVRTMPNTSSTIGLGATAVAFSPEVTDQQAKLVLELFRTVGLVETVAEPFLDAVTALSGSGPAYVYLLMEAMAAEAAAQGLDPGCALRLATQTALGAAEMVRKTGEHPAELRRRVASPNGTTQAALEILDRMGFVPAVRAAMRRAAERSQEIGLELDRSIPGA
ncbi:MAG: pyrroline-5-carboxylate reductase [Candidatus Reconcilbacillus cellulovorans]|uniref:Pyrroline-5-carboxylate reductase n=1 Tax=Candidatus Reconcilbacillus cellulovorans TaxID=1906605 RepID=A0A2A6E3E6_9BACL|nr:MAG: pyrroline-5-carboxylate reductase [Candidatus Reconcilbacillus cellulovorans]